MPTVSDCRAISDAGVVTDIDIVASSRCEEVQKADCDQPVLLLTLGRSTSLSSVEVVNYVGSKCMSYILLLYVEGGVWELWYKDPESGGSGRRQAYRLSGSPGAGPHSKYSMQSLVHVSYMYRERNAHYTRSDCQRLKNGKNLQKADRTVTRYYPYRVTDRGRCQQFQRKKV